MSRRTLHTLGLVGDADVLDLLSDIEDAFAIRLPDTDIIRCVTLGDFYAAVQRVLHHEQRDAFLRWDDFTASIAASIDRDAEQMTPYTLLLTEGVRANLIRWLRNIGRKSRPSKMNPEDIIKAFALEPHPEGGHFRETFRDPRGEGGRSVSTAIYYLLRQGERSHWHRVDAAEVWHHYAGAPLTLRIGGRDVRLGADLLAGERPQAVVPAGVWQSAECSSGWCLVGCTVAPAFRFEGFEMAPPGFDPRA